MPDGPHERLILEGPDRLSTVDLLTVLLGRRGRARRASDAAWRLLERFRSLRRIAGATIGELDGLGPVSTAGAARLVAAFALARRAYSRRMERGEPFRSSLEIYERYASLLRDARKERFFVVLLDGKNRVMREDLVSEGSLTSSPAHPREVFAIAMREAAVSIVLVHNHPSGDPEPSEDDIEELKNDCAMDRTSSTSFLANQLRVLMAAAAFALYQEMRWELRGTELARAQTSTLRLRIVKIAGQLIRSTRRLLVRLPRSCPDARIWCKLAYRIGASPG